MPGTANINVPTPHTQQPACVPAPGSSELTTHRHTASPVPPIPLAIAPTPSGSFHSISGCCSPLPYLPMKTDLVGMSGPKEEANKEEMCGIQSLNRQGSLGSNREDDRASLILTLTLYNVRKAELSKAAKVFEVQTSISPSFAELPLLSLLPSRLTSLPSHPSPAPACLTPHAAFPLSPILVLLQLLREVGWSHGEEGEGSGGGEHLRTVF